MAICVGRIKEELCSVYLIYNTKRLAKSVFLFLFLQLSFVVYFCNFLLYSNVILRYIVKHLLFWSV